MEISNSPYVGKAREFARKEGLDPELFVRQIQQESSFNPKAESPDGAIGIAQFIPGTAAEWGVNPWDAISSLDGAARFMTHLRAYYGGDYAKALAAYNAGQGAVDGIVNQWDGSWKEHLPEQTKNYIHVILEASKHSGTTLAHFPMVSQLTGDPGDKNAQFNCVPASIAAAMLWYQGEEHWTRQINPERLKDLAYYDSYAGMTDFPKYIEACASLGFKLSSIEGDPADLVAQAHQLLKRQIPVIFTEPDDHASPSLGWTHVCVFYGEEPGSLIALDPYGAEARKHSDEEWIRLLRFYKIWIVEKAMLDIKVVSNYFTDQGNDTWKNKQTGMVIGHGILDFYRRTGSAPFYGLTLFGLPRTGENPIPGHAGSTMQIFERAVLAYNPSHDLDRPPGSGVIFPMHIDGGIGLIQLAQYLNQNGHDGKALPPATIKALQTLRTNFDQTLDQVLTEMNTPV